MAKLPKVIHLNLRSKLTIGFIALELFISLALGITMYIHSIDMFSYDFREHKLSIAKFVSSLIRGEIHQKFIGLESVKSHEFKEYYRIIASLYENEPYVRYIYTLNFDREKEKLYYGIDATKLDADTIWVESDDMSFSAFVKNNQITIDYNYEFKDSSFQVVVPGKGLIKIDLIQGQEKRVLVNGKELFRILNLNPLEIETKEGVLNETSRSMEVFFPIWNETDRLQLSFTQKGHPGSDPGIEFFETTEQKEKIKNLIKIGRDSIDDKATFKSYGSLLSAYSVIKDSKGQGVGIVIVDVESKEIQKFESQFTLVAVALSFVVFIISTIVSFLLAKYFTLPVELLSKAVERLASGNLETLVEITSKDEFGKLANSFNVMVNNLKIASEVQFNLLIEITQLNESLEQKVKDRTRTIQEQSVELNKQIQIAQKIQNSLLPAEIPEFRNASISFKYLPMMGVGGDFVDFYYRNQDEIHLFICDVSGHGVPAAFLATMVKMSLQECYDLRLGPVESLAKIHSALHGKMSGHFISAIFCIIDLNTGKMRSANAGHLPLIHVKSEGYAKYISSKGRVINEHFPLNTIEEITQLNPGDKIFLYTDGITEARNDKSEMFGDDRLLNLVSEYHNYNTNEMCEKIYEALIKYVGNASIQFSDDITFLIAEYLHAGDHEKNEIN